MANDTMVTMLKIDKSLRTKITKLEGGVTKLKGKLEDLKDEASSQYVIRFEQAFT